MTKLSMISNSLVCMVSSLVSSPNNDSGAAGNDAAAKEEGFSTSNAAQQNRGQQSPVDCEQLTKEIATADNAMTDVPSDTESDTSSLSPPQSPASTIISSSGSDKEEEEEIRVPRAKRGERVLLNPLAIKFSQPRCRPNFQDGREVNDASTLVTPVAFAEARATPEEGAAEEESSEEDEEYDAFLAHPFPTIEVIRWRAKARAADGSWVKDPETGKDVMGEEQWFTLDNRRLYALQKAAARAWPKRCCVVVRVLRGDFGHALKKFKTSSNGRTVEVGNRFWGNNEGSSNTNLTWSWEETVEAATPDPAISPAVEEQALEAIERDERRPNELACLRAKGCARLLELPQYKGQEVTLAELKLPASTTEKKTESRRFEYWLASKEGTRVAKKPAAATAVAKKTANAAGSADQQQEKPAAAISFTDKMAALMRENKKAPPPSSPKVNNLLALMRKASAEESEATTRASSADEATGAARQTKWASAAPAEHAADEKRSEKRKQRGRQNAAGGAAAARWVAK